MEKADQQGHFAGDGVEEQISAADYDPSLDRKEDEEKRLRAVVEKDGEHQEAEMIEVEDEEEEHRRLEMEIQASRAARVRRSAGYASRQGTPTPGLTAEWTDDFLG